MSYKLSTKNAQGKWNTYGYINDSAKGGQYASIKVSALKELLELAEINNKDVVFLSLFEDEKKDKQADHVIAKGNAYVAQPADLSDEIPF